MFNDYHFFGIFVVVVAISLNIFFFFSCAINYFVDLAHLLEHMSFAHTKQMRTKQRSLFFFQLLNTIFELEIMIHWRYQTANE